LRAPVPASVSAAVVGSTVVGLAISRASEPGSATRELLALGVAPDYRRQGVATALLEAHAASGSFAVVTLAERDPVDPLPREARISIARRLFERAGLEISAADNAVRAIDPSAIKAWKR
jgi:ribosomal protein S18 acetylase RimI-like enzyme